MRRAVVLLATALSLACQGIVVAPPDGGKGWPPQTVKQRSIDEIDLLFAIDNSGSMGDKQTLLAEAVPTLIARLLNPDCVDLATGTHFAGDNGGGDLQCKSIPNTKPEFVPVHDMHVGIVSSSLGGGGSPDVCSVSGSDTTHQDDKGHLLNRTLVANADGPPIGDAKPLDGNGGDFLAWLPASDPKNTGKTPPNVTPYGDGQETQLVSDFQSLVLGVQQHGCGLEAQLESWYRFLVQPDPYDSITLSSDNPPRAQYEGVDATLLKMRHDFLRPDSLVAIVQITDEEDSWSDPMWLGGFGWTTRTANFPGGPGGGVGPRGTHECDAQLDPNNPSWGPNNPDCTSCAFPGSNKPLSGSPIGEDPNCQSCAGGVSGCQHGWYTPQQDGLNVRYGEQYMRSRYGLDPQYDVRRYVDGLTSTQVPDSAHEDQNGGSSTVGNYAPVKNCTNPLFAEDLPDGSDTSSGALCNLKLGSRTPDLIFYALIGGVPNELLEDANGNPKTDLSSSDWTKIVGNDPSHYDLTGIDPHMVESQWPRSGVETGGASYNLGDPQDAAGEGATHPGFREWNTSTSAAGTDLQFACTFDLPAAKDCTLPENQGACDCATTAPDGPPLCDPQNRTSQIKGKAYPTIRELRVAEGLGERATVASICAKKVSGSTADPTFGYDPAMNGIVDRLKNALSGQCLGQELPVGSDGTVSCTMLVVYPSQTNQSAGCTDPGMAQPEPSVLAQFDHQYLASLGDAGAGQQPPVLCELEQLVQGVDYVGATCEGSSAPGWCYVQGAANTGGCAQAIRFSVGEPPPGTTVDLECSQ